MALPIPAIGTDSGLVWEQSVDSALVIIDGHNHTSGSGVPVIPAGLNINSDLTFQSNNATFLRSVRFAPQMAPISGALDLDCVYVSGVDLYYNDGNGNQIQMTSGGSVLATSSGITSGTASASFVSSVLVVDAATNTPANIKGGSLLLGNNTAGTQYLTLSPPSAMASSYPLVLPLLPAANSFVTLDTSGNFGTITQSGGIVASNIAAGTITTTQIAASTIQDSNLAILKVATGTKAPFTTTNTSVTPTGLQTSLTPHGGSVMVMFPNMSWSCIGQGATGQFTQSIQVSVFRTVSSISTLFSTFTWEMAYIGGGTVQLLPGNACMAIDTSPTSGVSNTYSVSVVASASTAVGFSSTATIMAMEL